MARKQQHSELPSRETLLEFIRDSEKAVARREIARAFNITADDRRLLSAMLNDLEDEGAIGRGGGRRYSTGSGVPSVSVLDITGIDADGEPECQLIKPPPGPAPRIRLIIGKGRGRPPGIGDRLLVRLDAQGGNRYSARVIRRLPPRPSRIFGVIRKYGDRTMVEPADRRLKTSYLIQSSHKDGFRDGDMVACETTAERDKGLPVAKVTERIGPVDDPATVAPLMIARHEIPDEFAPDAVAAAEAAGPAPMEKRFDLRDIPLVTIDDEDARDFDDAVWAAPDEADGNKGGWRLIVAIADVAWYVRPGDALDNVAAARGNSVYLPGKVVPMLPEALSNGWCSLNPDEDRPCLAVEMRIDAKGVKLEHRFHRAMMRSAARLTYHQVQASRDGGANPTGADLPPGLLDALYGAYRALNKARIARGTLDLELPERSIVFDDKGGIDRIEKRTRRDSHRLIEEFMIQANVCAAETLEAKKQPCMYRIHEDPEPDRIVALRQYLRTLGYSLAGGQAVRPRHFSALIRKLKGKPEGAGVQDAILRCQAKAVYSPENPGHFGLALRRYAHFTSPIRRYSDLMVHRALITGSGLGPGGLGDIEPAAFEQIASHISMTERRAVAAERDAFDRLAALYLARDAKAELAARVTGVERFGLFVELEETGASGLLPVSALGEEYFRFEAEQMALIGDSSGEKFSLGDRLQVRLAEVSTETGSISLYLADREPRASDGRRSRSGGRHTGRKKYPNRKRGSKFRVKQERL